MAYEVKVFHHKVPAKSRKGWRYSGVTIAVVWVGSRRYCGVAYAHGANELKPKPFCKRIGRAIAVGRATHLADVCSGMKRSRALSRRSSESSAKFMFWMKKPDATVLTIRSGMVQIPKWMVMDVCEISFKPRRLPAMESHA